MKSCTPALMSFRVEYKRLLSRYDRWQTVLWEINYGGIHHMNILIVLYVGYLD